MTDRIADLWGERTPFGPGEEWPVRVDQFLEEGVSSDEIDRWVQTVSILHPNGDGHTGEIRPFVDRYGEDASEEPERLHPEPFGGTRSGGLGLLRDLQDVFVMASECEIPWTVIGQAARGARDRKLLEVTNACAPEASVQLKWINTRMKQAAPQALLVAS